MKRHILIISMLCFALSSMAKATSDTFVVIDGDTIQLKGAHPWRNSENENGIIEDYTHWSIAPMIGFNYFDGDFSSEKKHAFYGPSLGAFFDYSFTPVWGINVEYMWSRYGVTGKNNSTTVKTLLKGDMHKLGLGLNMDIISLFFPLWNRKLFCGFPSVGAGYMWYKNSVMYPDYTRHHTKDYEPSKMDKYKGTFYIQLGVAFEVNLNRSLGIGLRATYCYFMNDYTDNRGYSTEAAWASKNNDGIFDVVGYLRWKFNPIKRTHTRNVYSFDSWKRNKKGGMGDIDVAHDTIIIERHDSIIIREVAVDRDQVREIAYDNSQYYYVYFANNSPVLDDRALVTIQQVADRLIEDDEMYAIVVGYCDNTGATDANFILGDKRAESVISELYNEYDIDLSRMYGVGMGKIAGKGRSSSAYGPNRRAVIRLVSKQTFKRMKEDLEETKTMRATHVEAVSAKGKSEDLQKRESNTVTVHSNTTLGKLARTHYGNSNCWVYIFLANRDKLQSPDRLEAGMELVLPELTDQEKSITKDECLILYGMSRSASQN